MVRGLPCLVGVTAGMGLMMFVVPLGLGSLILTNPLVIKALNWAGAAFLLWLSWKIATSRRMDSLPDSRPVGFIGAAVFQWVNPKSWLVTASAAGAFLHAGAGSPVLQSALLGGLFFLVALPSCFVWLAFGATAQRLLQTPRRLRAFNITMGILLALSIGLIFW
jgi:threonine/homoserine/homoserine lactone efflux protein